MKNQDNKKNIYLNLHYNIDELICMQKFSLEKMVKSNLSEKAKNFQKDILTILQAIQQMDIIDLDAN